MRLGENENCILCRGESSCIVPINTAAVHTKPADRAAIGYFTEYLEQFPDDIGVKWLLNVAHMTLGEFPSKVDPRYLLDLDGFLYSGLDIGKFRDVGHLLGVNRFNQAGGAIMDDFDGDSLLDIAVTTMDPAGSMAIYRNRGDGTFEDRSDAAGVTGQLGGLVCYQTDYNNDGRLDVYVPRGAWLPHPSGPASCGTTAGEGSPTSRRKPAWPKRSTPTRLPGPIMITMAGSTSSSPAKSNSIGCSTIAATARFWKLPPRPESTAKVRNSSRAAPGSTLITTGFPISSSTA